MPDQPDLAALREKAEDELWDVTGWWPGPALNAYFEAVGTLQGENDRMRSALEFYASRKPSQQDFAIPMDRGQRARAALAPEQT